MLTVSRQRSKLCHNKLIHKHDVASDCASAVCCPPHYLQIFIHLCEILLIRNWNIRRAEECHQPLQSRKKSHVCSAQSLSNYSIFLYYFLFCTEKIVCLQRFMKVLSLSLFYLQKNSNNVT